MSAAQVHQQCSCGYEVYVAEPHEICPSCGRPLTSGEEVSARPPAGQRRDATPDLVWSECLGCGRTMIADEDRFQRYCPRCRNEEPPLSLEGLDLYKGRTGGSRPDGG